MKTLLLLSTIISTVFLSSCAPVVVGAVVVSGINVANDRRSTGQVIDDKLISSHVRKEIGKSISNDEHIKVMTYNGVVLLVGEAQNAEDKIKAEDSAAARNGVVRVINELHESIPSGFKRRTKDSYITSKAKSSLLTIEIKEFNASRVRIMTTRGIVYLMGRVNHQESDAVVEKIRNLKGVVKVVKVFEYVD